MNPAQGKKVLVVLPDTSIPPYTAARINRLVRMYFPEPQHRLRFAVPGSAAPYAGHFDSSVEPLRDAMVNEADIFVVSETLRGSLPLSDARRYYTIEHNHWHVMLTLHSQAIDEHDYPWLNAHEFNKLAPREGYNRRNFFPFGYNFRECGNAGPLDAFGFRLDKDVEALRDRPSQHKLIAVIGGSAAGSWYAFFDELFSQRLEVLLNEQAAERGTGETFTVLNFAQGGTIVLHHMIVWMLHVERLRPEIVISHDGYNDLLWGLNADPFLMNRAICAPSFFESWCQKLHDRQDVAVRFPPGETMHVVNPPRKVVEQYVERKLQLDRWIRSSGANHISALQPHAQSKRLSSIEIECLNNPRYNGNFAELYKRVPPLYDAVREALRSHAELPFFDLHEYFGRFGEGETLFCDYMHTTPAGDEVLARAYYDWILDRALTA